MLRLVPLFSFLFLCILLGSVLFHVISLSLASVWFPRVLFCSISQYVVWFLSVSFHVILLRSGLFRSVPSRSAIFFFVTLFSFCYCLCLILLHFARLCFGLLLSIMFCYSASRSCAAWWFRSNSVGVSKVRIPPGYKLLVRTFLNGNWNCCKFQRTKRLFDRHKSVVSSICFFLKQTTIVIEWNANM